MSAYLGPIHYWVFNKINFQNNLVQTLIDFAKERNFDIASILGEKYENLEEGPLEEIIDESNIHGWLQTRVTLVEYKFAESVKLILDNKVATANDLKHLFYEIGAMTNKNLISSAIDAYKILNDLLLDGMPCDRANELVSESDDEIIWKRRICVHSSYWQEVGINIEIYYSLRESFINGLLEKSDYIFSNFGEEYRIIKKGK